MNIPHSKEHLLSLFDYDENTGLLTWKDRPRNHFKRNSDYAKFKTHHARTVAGYKRTDKDGKSYIKVRIKNKQYKAEKIIAKMVGWQDSELIDHINGNGSDNRLSNLRPADALINSKNHRLRKDNKTGIYGVHKRPNGKYQVYINGCRKGDLLGTFADFFEACCARKKAELEFDYHKNHGTIRPL